MGVLSLTLGGKIFRRRVGYILIEYQGGTVGVINMRNMSDLKRELRARRIDGYDLTSNGPRKDVAYRSGSRKRNKCSYIGEDADTSGSGGATDNKKETN